MIGQQAKAILQAARGRATAIAGLAGVATLSLALPAAGQAPPKFPMSLEREPLLYWLEKETDITPDKVVAVTPQAITAVMSSFPPIGGQGPRVVLRAEALNGETHARTGALSWHVSLSADCAGHRVRMGETTGYPERNLLGERRVLRPAESEWRTPEAGTALDAAWRVACDMTFVGPFQDPSTKVSQSDVTPPPALAAATPAPAEKPAPSARRPVPAVPAPARAASPPPAAAVRGGLAVQIGSFPDRASATAALDALHDDHAHGLDIAVVDGRTRYRAVVSGFATPAEAAQYCAKRQAAGAPCLVRAPPRS